MEVNEERAGRAARPIRVRLYRSEHEPWLQHHRFQGPCSAPQTTTTQMAMATDRAAKVMPHQGGDDCAGFPGNANQNR